MNLADYLIAVNLTPAQFARLVGVQSRNTIHRYISGERIPRSHILSRIEYVTRGMVTAQDFEEARDRLLNVANDNSPDYPWSRGQEELAEKTAQQMVEKVRSEPPEGSGPSPAMQAALSVLGSRVTERFGMYHLDGRPVRIATLIRHANRILMDEGKLAIRYPGVMPVLDDVQDKPPDKK